VAGELTKGYIGKEDLKLQINTSTAETWSRLTSVGGTQTLTKFPDIWGGTGNVRAAWITLSSQTAPSSSPADKFQMYSADIAAGHAAPHIRNENGTIVKLYQQAHVTDASVAHAVTATGCTPLASSVNTVLNALGTKINTILTRLENLGFHASS